jgi:hypothetical protein
MVIVDNKKLLNQAYQWRDFKFLMTIKDGERLAVLEQKVNDVNLSLLDLKSDIKEIKNSLPTISDFENRIKKLEGSSNLWKWLAPSLAAVLGSLLTFLIINFLQNSR